MTDSKTHMLVKLKEDGTLGLLYDYGIITPTVFKMLEARLKVESMINQGYSRGKAVIYTAKMLGVTPKHCYTYLR